MELAPLTTGGITGIPVVTELDGMLMLYLFHGTLKMLEEIQIVLSHKAISLLMKEIADTGVMVVLILDFMTEICKNYPHQRTLKVLATALIRSHL